MSVRSRSATPRHGARGAGPSHLLAGALVALVVALPARAAEVSNPTAPAEFRAAPAFAADSTTPASPEPAPAALPFRPFAVRDSAAAPPDSAAGPIGWMWVLRDQLIRREDIPKLVVRAKEMGVRGLLVQVVGRGDAYYRSDLLPPPEPLGAHAAERDPLGELVPLAHASGLQVHAWVVACLAWSGDRKPRDPRHVLNAHPEWIARTEGGRALSSFSAFERERLGLEGAFLSPAHPRVPEHIARVAQEIVRRYDVDGIHLDYIRQPSVDIGFDQTSRARFAMEHQVDPARFALLPPDERRSMQAAWVQFQRDNVTAIVRAVRDSIRAVRPNVELSAAVFADTITARTRIRQPWMDWLRDGLLDRAFTMSYATRVQTVVSQLAGYELQLGEAARRLVPGLAVYNAPAQRTAAKVKAARELGFPAVALYSYDSLWREPDGWETLRGFLATRDAAEFVFGP